MQNRTVTPRKTKRIHFFTLDKIFPGKRMLIYHGSVPEKIGLSFQGNCELGYIWDKTSLTSENMCVVDFFLQIHVFLF